MTDDPKEPFNKAGSIADQKQSQDKGRIDQAMDREAFERHRRIHQTPVSTKELNARKKLRALPKLVLVPTPNGGISQALNNRVQSENERRIHFLEKRLGRIEGQAKKEFDKKR